MKTLLRLAALALVLSALFSLDAGAEKAPLSTGIEVLRAETRLIKCCVNGERVGFTAEEFKTLTGTEFEYVTITKLPKLSDGVLKLTGVDVQPNQQVSVSGLQHLKFVPGKDFSGVGRFGFTVAATGWESKEIECVIRYSETANFAPIAVDTKLNTYKSVSVTAPLGAYDPDGDRLSYVVERYPTGGTVSIEDGAATYTPLKGFVGADSFTYRTVDVYGNKSKVAEASIKVSESKSGIYFADMKDKSAHLAAIRAAEKEVMTYTLIGDSYYFAPKEQVSRIDFAVMLVCAADVNVPNKDFPTDIFTDTATQSKEKRLYLETAVTSGFIAADSAVFRPDEPITITEAVAMTENALGDSLPTVGSAYFENGERALTKEDAAVILSALYK